jgi:RNA polymerase sigma factor (sigma-70 family)
LAHKSAHIDSVQQRALLERIAVSDEAAFAELLRVYGDTIFSQAMAYVKSVEVAEELVQDIFLRVWKNRGKLWEVESLENWLFILARNLVFDSFKKKVSMPLVAILPNGGYDGRMDTLTPDLHTEARESWQVVLKGIDQLPEKRQQVFRMSRLEGMSHKEIAKALNIHEVTVAQYIVKSLSFLKSYLEEHGTDTIMVIILLRGL